MKKTLNQLVAVTVVGVGMVSSSFAQDSFKGELDKELRSLTRKVRADKSKRRSYRVAQNDVTTSSELNRYETNSVKSSLSTAKPKSSASVETTETTYSIVPTSGGDYTTDSTSSSTTTSTVTTSTVTNPATAEIAPIVVEDTPLQDTKVKKLKTQRKTVETETEIGLAEELEQDRIDREKERAARARKGLKKSNSTLESEFESTSTKSEAVSTAVVDNSYDEPTEPTRFYIQAMGGTADYPGLRNARGVFAWGLSVGLKLPERLMFELGYNRATYDVENWQPFVYMPTFYGGIATLSPRITQMDQNMYSGALKYQILSTKVTPVIGVLASYSERTFTDRQYNGLVTQPTTLKSNTFDAGPLLGLDVKIGSMLEAGFDFRYMFNLTYRRDQYLDSFGNNYGYTPIEEAQWWLGTAHLRVLF